MYTANQDVSPETIVQLADPVTVRYQGLVIVFARVPGQPLNTLYYNVRVSSVVASGEQDFLGWDSFDLSQTTTKVGALPQLLRIAGMGLISVPPLVNTPSPADASFRIISDDKFLYLFRVSTNNTLYLDRFVLIQTSGADPNADEGQVVPPQYNLDPIWEVRYQRSGLLDTPAGPKDSLSYRDVNGDPFIEPTTEIVELGPVTSGNFTVLMVPSVQDGGNRWQFFMANTTDNTVKAISFVQLENGLPDFNLEAAQIVKYTPLLGLTAGSAPLTCTGGIDAALYGEQEPADPTDPDAGTLKRTARVMVAIPVSAAAQGLAAATAILDYGLASHGTIPPIPAALLSPLIDGVLENNRFTPTVAATYPITSSLVNRAGAATVYAYALGQCAASAAPQLLDSSDGLVHCYFAGTPQNGLAPFLVAQYNPIATRATVSLNWAAGPETGIVDFIALRTGTSMSGLSVAVTAAGGGSSSQSDLCDLTITYGTPSGIGTETWIGVPQNVNDFLAVLNGYASAEPTDAGVLAGATPFFDYTGLRLMVRIPQTLSADGPSNLTLVSTRPDVPLAAVTVAQPTGSTTSLTVTFTAGGHTLQQTWQGVPVNGQDMVSILRGGAAWNYSLGSGDTQAFGLASSGSSVLLFLQSAVNPAQVTLTVVPPASGQANVVDVKIINAGNPINLANVPNDGAGFASTLTGNTSVMQVFAFISAGPNPGTVAAQSGAVVNLQTLSTLFSVLSPLTNDPVSAGSVTASRLQGHSQTAPTTTPLPQSMVGATAVSVGLPANGVPGMVTTPQNSTQSPMPSNGQWTAVPTLYSLQLNKQGAMTVPTNTPQSAVLSPARYMTVEAWVQPIDGVAANLVTYDGAPPAAGSIGLVPSYALSTIGQDCMQFGVVTGGVGSSCSSIGITPASSLTSFPPSYAFTWEVWVSPTTPIAPNPSNGSIIQLYDPANPLNTPLEIALNTALHPQILYSDGTSVYNFTGSSALPAAQWSHLALTGLLNATSKIWQFNLYVNGGVPQSFTGSMQYPPGILLFLGGAGGGNDPSLAGKLAEVRLWEVARTRFDLKSSMNMSLSGMEPGLLGYWKLSENPTQGATIVNSCVSSGTALNGAITIIGTQPMSQSTDSTFLSLLAGMGGAPAVTANAFLVSGQWNHVAVTFEAGTGVAFVSNNETYIDCGHASEFDLAQAFTIEAWIQVPSFNNLQNALVSKWGTMTSSNSFLLGISNLGLLTGSIVPAVPLTAGGSLAAFSVTAPAGSTNIIDGNLHHVAVAYSSAGGADSNGNISATGTLTLYVDGQQVATGTTGQYPNQTSLATQTTNSDVVLGAIDTQDATVPLISSQFFQGVMTGVRIWQVALTAAQIQQSIAQLQNYSTNGVISEWWFTEQSGATAADMESNNNGTLSRNDMWTLIGPLSSMQLYANGNLLVTAPAAAGAVSGYPTGDQQFTVGGCMKNGALINGFDGQMDEIRIWNTARSNGQLDGARFTPLSGDEPGLIAYWNFDDQKAIDETGRGNNGAFTGTTPPSTVASSAPISNEGPYVLNVYGGSATSWQLPLLRRSAVLEYGDTSRLSDGTLSATLARGYYFVSDVLVLPAGISVGLLRLTYLGQVQTNPTLDGYIEGCPPVPSENLSRPLYSSTATPFFNYFGASTVTLKDTETSTLTFTSSDSVGTIPYDITAGIGYAFANKAAAGALLSFRVSSGELSIQAKYKGSETIGKINALSRSSSWTDTISDTIALRGDWEPAQADRSNYLNPTVGRIFIPANIGYALVTSSTADLYAMQLNTTGAMVGKVTVPNLDIPPDVNILTFQIDPGYIKNGTLDGKIGLANDPSYPDADTRRGSYFKPLESYKLKQKVQNQTLDLAAYYEQFDVTQAQQKNYDINFAQGLLTDLENKLFVNRTNSAAVGKSLVNTYVWTADGGLHSEEEQFLDQKQVTYSGFRKEVNTAGISIAGKALFGTPVNHGVVGSFDYLGGQQIDVTVSKSRTDASGFGLTVTAVGDPILLGWDQAANSGSGAYTTTPIPGKVTAYRFNAFYLAPSSDNASNFKSIVDPVWYRSDDPNAVALRSASVDGNLVWRVLYRVTYVSRVPPPYQDSPGETVAPEYTRTIIVQDNSELVVLVVNQLGHQLVNPVNLANAIAAVIAPHANDGVYPKSVIGTLIPWWEIFLATTRPGNSYNAAAAVWLNSLLYDTLTYMLTGFANGDITPAQAGNGRITHPQLARFHRSARRPTAN